MSLLAPVVMAGGLSAGCSSSSDKAPSGGTPGLGDTPVTPGGSTPEGSNDCATPEQGCACSDEGDQAPCAYKIGDEGAFVHCALGQRTCQGGHWGTCDPSGQTATVPAVSEDTPGLSALGLGVSTKCLNNPCDPYCYSVVDNSVGYTPPTLVQASDGSGVTLKPGNKPVIPATGFRIAPKPSVTIRVTGIPLGNYPVVDVEPQFTGELLCGTPAASCSPPKFTVTNWSLNTYQNLLISNQGKVSVIKPIPSQATVLGKADGYTDSSQVKVVVDVHETPNVPASVASSFETLAKSGGLPVDNFNWLYPYKNTVFPRGLTAPLIQTDIGPAGSQLTNGVVKYTLRHRRPDTSVDFEWSRMVSQTGTPRYTIPQHVWQYFDETSSGQSAELAIQRGSLVCADTPNGCQDSLYNGKRYRFCKAGNNWSAARAQCQAMGMDLTSINDAAEGEFVGSTALSVSTNSWWIGATNGAGGPYKWSDGSPFGYSRWSNGQPDNGGNNEHCAEIWNANSGDWNDNNCAAGDYFVCEGANTNPCSVGQVRQEVVLPIKFSSEPMQGTVYFWEINNGRIAKITDDGTLVQNFLAPVTDASDISQGQNPPCLACHTVSADGTTLVAQRNGGGGRGTAFTTAGAQTFVRNSASEVMGVSPDGYWTLWNDWGILSPTTNDQQAAFQYGKGVIPVSDSRLVAPAWSPDGKWIAWTRREYADGTWGWYVDFNQGDLYITQFNDKRPMVTGSGNCSDYTYNGQTYRFCADSKNWQDAQASCQSMGLNLASVSSLAEDNFIAGTANSIASGSWWFGANDIAVEGSFKWPDGSPFSYSRWNPGEPNDYGGNEDCGELITSSGTWNDNNCAGGRYYICKGTNPSLLSWDYFTNTTTLAGANGWWDTSVYPSFSPDSNYVIYQQANAVRTRGNYGRLRLVKRDTPGQSVTLDNANQATVMASNGTVSIVPNQDTISYEPTFSPIESGGYYWSVFVSNRWYGNTIHPTFGTVRPDPNQHLKDSGYKQLWVTAIPKNPSMAGDPSSPAFRLPGQDIFNQNMRGYFAKTACKATNNACQWDEDCCGFGAGTALCVLDQPVTAAAKRHCGSFTPGVCVAEGNSCTDSAQCCQNPKSLECIQGVCIEPQPAPYFAPASFTREYEGTCAQGSRVVWRTFSWKGTTPGDSSISVVARTAETSAALASATPAPVTELTPGQCESGWHCGDVKQALDSLVPPQVSKLKLQVTITLNPTSDNSQPPVLSDWKQAYDCTPSE